MSLNNEQFEHVPHHGLAQINYSQLILCRGYRSASVMNLFAHLNLFSSISRRLSSFLVTSSGRDTAPPATEPPQRPSTTRRQPSCLHESEAIIPLRGSHTWDTHLSRLFFFFKKIGFIFICADMFLMISKCLYGLHSMKLSPISGM